MKIRYYEFDQKTGNYEVGKLFSESIKKALSDLKEFPETFYKMKEKLINTYPAYYNEVCQRADGSSVDRDKYLYFVSHELNDNIVEKCSDIIVKKTDGSILLGHNEDGDYSEFNSAFIKYSLGNKWYIEYTSIDSLSGTTFMWNSDGIIFTVNHINTFHKNMEEVSSWFILRDLIGCSSIEEIEEVLKMSVCASGFNLNVIINDKIYDIEFYLDKYIINEIDNIYCHTNHFIYIVNSSITDSSNTIERYDLIKSKLSNFTKDTITINDVREILEYTTNEYKNTIHVNKEVSNNITSCLFTFDSKTNQKVIYDYLDRVIIKF